MSNDLNMWQGIGRLGKDPEIRYTQSGSAVASLSIACGESWKDKTTGEKKESTEWVNLTAFGKLAEIIGEYLKKGNQIYVSGKLKTEKYTDKSGVEKYSTKVIIDQMQMLGGREQPQGQPQDAHNQAKSNGYQDFDDSDIPF